MKILFRIIIVIVVLGAVAAYFANKAWSKMNLKFFFKGIDFGGLTLQQATVALLTGQTINIKLFVGCDITNGNNFVIPFSKFRAKLFYNGNQIAETSDALYNQKIKVPANSVYSLTDTANVFISSYFINLLKTTITGSTVIDYEIRLSIFGIPIPFPIKNNFSITIK